MNSLDTDILTRGASRILDVDLTTDQLNAYRRFADLLVDWNENRLNLTRLISPSEIAIKHILDSLIVFKAVSISMGSSLIDIGTGAGIPGIILKIFRPDLKITLMDSTAKKLGFCNAFIQDAGLSDICSVHGRAEVVGKTPEHARQYDFAISRAVAPLNKLLPWCHPFVKPGGSIIAMKGPLAEGELKTARPIAARLRLDILPICSINISEPTPARSSVLPARGYALSEEPLSKREGKELPEAGEPVKRCFVIAVVK